jgi:hypothetical protein
MTLASYVRPRPEVSDPFPTFVEYFQPPYEALARSFEDVDPDFRGAPPFRPMPVCEGVSHVARLVPLRLVRLGLRCQEGDACSIMDEHGLRPALYEELLALGKARPGIAREGYVIAIGSWTHVRTTRNAFLASGRAGGARLLMGFVLDGLDHDYSADDRFLAVAKTDDP